MTPLRLGYSPCPNDTFILHALTFGLVPGAPQVDVVMDDVETLNRWALDARLEATKISYHAYAHVRDRYVALRSGGAMGEGAGPLLVATTADLDVSAARVAVPGRMTTAALLLSLVGPTPRDVVELRYDEIPSAVASGLVDAGLIIHESRFTYGELGLVALLDVGQAWEAETGLPVPLGAILVRRDLGDEVAASLDVAIRASLERAWADPQGSADYVRAHSAELSDDVIRAHIDLYVNQYSRDVGERGEAAVAELFGRAQAARLVPPGPSDVFVGQPSAA